MDTDTNISRNVIDRLSSYLKFENATSLIAISSAASIVMSVAIEFGYFSVFDNRLIFFLSLQDVVSNALTILPILIPLFILIIALADSMLFVSDSTEKSKVKIFLNQRFITVIAATALTAIGIFLVHFSKLPLVALFAIFFLGSAFVLVVRGMPKEASIRRLAFVYLFMGGLFLFMGIGELSGQYDLRSDVNNYEIRIGDDSIRALIVMATPDFVVVRDTQRQVRLIPRSKIDEINFLSVHK